MKKILLLTFILSISLWSTSCDDELNTTKSHLMQDVFHLEINRLEDTNHGLSHSSSSSSNSKNDLGFLDAKAMDCTAIQQSKFKVYQAVVALFGINKGAFRIDDKIVNKNYNEVTSLLAQTYDEEEDENTVLPVVSENEKSTGSHIQHLVYHYLKVSIDKVDLKKLEIAINDAKDTHDTNKIVNDKNNMSSLTLGQFTENLSNYIIADKIIKDKTNNKREIANFLFNIAEDKNFHKNTSWLAMNFYDTIGFAMDIKNGELPSYNEESLSYAWNQTIRSDLLVDMNNSEYTYFMSKNGKINDNNNRSSVLYHYFLAEDGVTNPYNELKATLHYFFDNNDTLIRHTRICEYNNRFILLKQLFKKYKVQKDVLNLRCNEQDEDEIRDYKYNYVYVTSGEDGDESYGHTMLHIDKGEKIVSDVSAKGNIQEDVKKMPSIDNETKSKSETKSTTQKLSSSTSTPSSVKDNNQSVKPIDLYINFGVPPMEKTNFIKKISYQLKGLYGGIYGKFNTHTSETFLSKDYGNRMVVKVPIVALDKDINKKILLEAHIQHILKNQERFKFPYKFISKNCAYIISDILEVPLPKLRNKFNKEGYLSFAPKDIFKLLEDDINVNAHQAKQYPPVPKDKKEGVSNE